jgi:hypothetical protein
MCDEGKSGGGVGVVGSNQFDDDNVIIRPLGDSRAFRFC